MRRRLVSIMAAALVAVLPLVAPPPSAVYADAKDLIPAASDLTAAFAPFAPLTVNKVAQNPGADGWDTDESMEVDGGPDGPVMVSVDASELPTNAAAAGFLQTKLQQLRDGAKGAGLLGDVGPASATLTYGADEAYYGLFVTPDGASSRFLSAVLISRYEGQVIATTTVMHWSTPGAISENAERSLGITLGVLAQQIDGLASDD